MAKHKAPNQVTLGSLQERTLLHEFVDRYWKFGVVLASGLTLAILISTYLGRQARDAHLGSWDALRAQADLGSGIFPVVQGGSAESLALFADQHRETPVGAWAKALEVGALIQADKLEDADKVAAQLAILWPDHLLSSAQLYPVPDGSPTSLNSSVRTGKARIEAWDKEHATLFSNPPLPPDAPRVRVSTSKGALVVGLYVDRAPRHAENFLRLCREGYYNRTKFHRVVRGSLIHGGDPNSIEGAPETWGSGGPETTLEPEVDPKLRHFKGALVAWKAPGETRSHGSQFFITTADQSPMDEDQKGGRTVVFGLVLEGHETLEAIESSAVVEDRPQDPAVIEATEIL